MWFDHNAKETADFYCSVFNDSRIQQESEVAVTFYLEGQKFMGLNGGPMFTINPSFSFFVFCATATEVTLKWDKLSDGGQVMMPLGNYPWCEKYGWCSDKYGVNWQIMLSKEANTQPIVPALMFTGSVSGKAEESIQYFTSLFPDSKIINISRHPQGSGSLTGQVNHGRFSLNGSSFVAFDGGIEHAFGFNEGVSLVVPCNTQEEIDYYWQKLTEGGSEGHCGWLKDKFGISWQIVPAILGDLMSDVNRSPKVMEAFLKMKKFDITVLLSAAHGN